MNHHWPSWEWPLAQAVFWSVCAVVFWDFTAIVALCAMLAGFNLAESQAAYNARRHRRY